MSNLRHLMNYDDDSNSNNNTTTNQYQSNHQQTHIQPKSNHLSINNLINSSNTTDSYSLSSNNNNIYSKPELPNYDHDNNNNTKLKYNQEYQNDETTQEELEPQEEQDRSSQINENIASSSASQQPNTSTNSSVSQDQLLQSFEKIKTHFPAARIKKIMQSDEEIGKVAQATPIVVGRALEIFMANLVESSIIQAKLQGVKRITAQHIKLAVEKNEQFDFLVEIVEKYPSVNS
ncbi:uncharacterized protein KGF55_001055 [Candida pseudojiufengensis]|uniref:uncharacterized protein n=1 Tax=Candida pseudojiufengensis TaxID=497109 RepID=UPI0022254221|nr:uncharacterized protein KGF55_001055 [Candida pseudojiufengensis]KAI5965693.1 hypothetical protein KGF55_001055 [Candida pseudojiufengensis]